jgi:site-specific recombinase XerD
MSRPMGRLFFVHMFATQKRLRAAKMSALIFPRTGALPSRYARKEACCFLSRNTRDFACIQKSTMADKTRAATIRPAQMRHLLRVTAATSRHPQRDALVLLLGITCAMRVTEIARLLVSDVLTPAGVIRHEVSLRAAITKGCTQRCIYLTHDLVLQALGAYIDHRWEEGHGTEFDRRRYRGLSPATPMVLTHKGTGFELQAKRRCLVGGQVETYWACDSLQAHVSRLYRDAGLQGCSSHSGRRTFATRLVAQGQPLETVQRLLGHAALDHTDDYIDVDSRTLAAMFAEAI